MILKQKKDCKLIFKNEKYYIHTNKILYHFGNDFDEATRYYDNIREIEKEGIARYYLNGKFHLDFYPDEIKLIIKSLECYKFFVDNNRFLDVSKEKLNNFDFDIEFLTQYMYSLYIEYIKEENKKGKD